MKKFLALALALVMALSLAACGKKADDNKGNGDEAKGSVYYLNFKPEADKAWQDLAKTYTEQTGVEVKVVTAASGQYDTMLTSELDKSAPPTMFQVGNQGAVNAYGDFCYPLDNADVMKEMTTQDFNLKNANGETVSIGYCYEAFGIIVNKALLEKMKTILGERVKDVRVSTTLKNHPVCITTDGAISMEMEKVLNSMPGAEQKVKAEQIFELNTEHPVFEVLRRFENDEDKLKKYTEVLYDQALLIEGRSIEDPVAYANNVAELLAQ